MSVITLSGVLVIPIACSHTQRLEGISGTSIELSPEKDILLSDIVFTRTGGFAGFDDHIRIDVHGNIHYDAVPEQSSTIRIPSGKLSTLAVLLEDSKLFDEDHQFTSIGADLVEYTIQYNGVTVRFNDDQVPSTLRPVLDQLLDLLNERPS